MKSPLLISVALFLIACCLPALEFQNSQSPNSIMWGANALAVGWSGSFAAVAGVVALVIATNTFANRRPGIAWR